MKLIRMIPPERRRDSRPALEPEQTLAEEFQPLFDKRAEELREARPETKLQRQARLAAIFENDVGDLFDTNTVRSGPTLAPTEDDFTTEALDALLNEKD